MTEQQPPKVTAGATGDIEDEVPPTTAKSAEDRKAASALASLDDRDDSAAAAAKNNIDQEAVGKAISNLSGAPGGVAKQAPTAASAAAPKKAVKIDQADVALLVEELDLPKARVTEMLRAADGDALETMRAYVKPAF